MKKFTYTLFLLVILVLVVTACTSSGDNALGRNQSDFAEEAEFAFSESGAADFGAPQEAPLVSKATSGDGEGFFFDEPSLEIANLQTQERIVIKNADLSLIVEEPTKYLQEIINMAEGMGGFVVSSNIYQTYTPSGEGVPGANVTFRVPSINFSAALEQLEATAEEVQGKNLSGRDITQEFTDLGSRLRNLEDAASQLRLIMADANKTEDVLAVYNQLTFVNEQAEVIKGQLNYFKEASDMSSISVSLTASAVIEPVSIGGWEPVGVARDAIQALVNALQGITNAVIWLTLYLLPVLLVLVLPFYIVFRIVRARQKQSKSKADSAA